MNYFYFDNVQDMVSSGYVHKSQVYVVELWFIGRYVMGGGSRSSAGMWHGPTVRCATVSDSTGVCFMIFVFGA